jgi:hypothetical protein
MRSDVCIGDIFGLALTELRQVKNPQVPSVIPIANYL